MHRLAIAAISGFTYEIALENPKDGFESIYCDHV